MPNRLQNVENYTNNFLVIIKAWRKTADINLVPVHVFFINHPIQESHDANITGREKVD